MRPNASEFPDKHYEALKQLENIDHPLIPKLYEYDDISYKCEYIDGEDLETYIQKTGDIDFAYSVLESVNDLLQKLSKIEFGDLKLSAEDIHSKNILVSNGKPYLIDLDQIGWWHPYTIFKIIMTTNVNICNTLQTSLLLYDIKCNLDKHKITIDSLSAKHKILSDKMHEKNEEIFENGVRHGFWNVNDVSEIKEQYEKYKCNS